MARHLDRRIKLSKNLYKIISFLFRLPGESKITTLKDIKRSTGISESTIKRAVTKLIEQGYILSKKRCWHEDYQGIEYVLNEELCKKSDVKTPEVLHPERIKHYTEGQNNISYPVLKANKLLEARYKLAVQEKRILLDMISKIQKDDDDFCVYRFDTKYLAELTGIKLDGLYSELKLITKRMLKKTLEIQEPEGLLQVNWLTSAKYNDKKGYVELAFSVELRPYLLGLSQLYKSYKLKNVIHLNSFYSIRIYELLKQYESTKQKSRTFKIDDFRAILKIPAGYKYSNIKSLIIKAQEELAEKTDILFTFTEKKRKQRVDSITFYIENNNEIAHKEKVREEESELKYTFEKKNVKTDPDLEVLLNIVPKQHRQKKSIKNLIVKLLKKYDIEHIKRNIEYTVDQLKDQRKFRAFLEKSVEDDWGLGYYEDKKQDEIEKEKIKEKQNIINQKRAEEERKSRLQQKFKEYQRNKVEEILNNLSKDEEEKLLKEFEEDLVKKGNNFILNHFKAKGLRGMGVMTAYHFFIVEKYLKPEDKNFENFAKTIQGDLRK